jgi:hypothetical protein
MPAQDPNVKATFQPTFPERLLVGGYHLINKFIPWHKLPSIIGALNLDALRIELRQYNLYDGYASGEAQGSSKSDPTPRRFETARNSEGKYNDTAHPQMGCSGVRFGRNFPRELTPAPSEESLWNPNPRMLSERFMKRHEFKPATTLNLLAAAWIQFQTHDWFFHESVSTASPRILNMADYVAE